ncbi:MAG: nucleoside monophosphate kinase [Patescibacteria group bacterium]
MVNNLVITILGEPGSGKGTQAKRIAKKFKLAHIETGDLIRRYIKTDPKAKAKYEQGRLQPNKIVTKLIEKEIAKLKLKRFILDPFPLNLAQIEFLFSMVQKHQLAKPILIYLKVNKKIALQRIIRRKDKRQDDQYNIAKKRIDDYSKSLKKVMSAVDDRFSVIKIDGNPGVVEVAKDIALKLTKLLSRFTTK